MAAGNKKETKFREELILASALLHTAPPRDVIRPNCSRVLEHALFAAGLWDQVKESVYAGFHGDMEDAPIIALWYSTLIALTRRKPKSKKLLEGGGNLVLPAGAYFTACWLTDAGRAAALKLFKQNPEWLDLLTAPIP